LTAATFRAGLARGLDPGQAFASRGEQRRAAAGRLLVASELGLGLG
jgi:hypothetical protein